MSVVGLLCRKLNTPLNKVTAGAFTTNRVRRRSSAEHSIEKDIQSVVQMLEHDSNAGPSSTLVGERRSASNEREINGVRSYLKVRHFAH
jgi:hypothetical protein